MPTPAHRQHGVGKGSGARVDAELFHLWTVRGGEVVEMRMVMGSRRSLPGGRPQRREVVPPQRAITGAVGHTVP